MEMKFEFAQIRARCDAVARRIEFMRPHKTLQNLRRMNSTKYIIFARRRPHRDHRPAFVCSFLRRVQTQSSERQCKRCRRRCRRRCLATFMPVYGTGVCAVAHAPAHVSLAHSLKPPTPSQNRSCDAESHIHNSDAHLNLVFPHRTRTFGL